MRSSLRLCFALLSLSVAGVKTETVEWKVGDKTFRGTLAFDESATGKRPGILVFPEWWGVNDYAKKRAEQLAALGYVALAADLYGDAKVTTDPSEAGKLAGEARSDPAVWRARAEAALAALKARKEVDGERIAAIGYCFGGSTALVLAAAGAPLRGVVSFHGNFPVAAFDGDAPIKPKLLLCNGGDDGFVSADERTKFFDALRRRKADYQSIDYAGATHSFSNPAAGTFGIKGIAYDEKADKRSWEHMKVFFAEALR